MSDLTAARERHVNCTVDFCAAFSDRFTVPCDVALFRDALDEMTAARDGYADLVDTLSRQDVAARALADELAEALRQQHGPWYDDGGCSCGHDPCAATAALAKWEASRRADFKRSELARIADLQDAALAKGEASRAK